MGVLRERRWLYSKDARKYISQRHVCRWTGRRVCFFRQESFGVRRRDLESGMGGLGRGQSINFFAMLMLSKLLL